MSRRLLTILVLICIVAIIGNTAVLGLIFQRLLQRESIPEEPAYAGGRFTIANIKDETGSDAVLIADGKTGEFSFLDYDIELRDTNLTESEMREALENKNYTVWWYRKGKVWEENDLMTWRMNLREFKRDIERIEKGPLGVHTIYDRARKLTYYWVAGDGVMGKPFSERKDAKQYLAEIKKKRGK